MTQCEKQIADTIKSTLKLMKRIEKELQGSKPEWSRLADVNQVYADMVDIGLFLGINP